MKKYVLGHTLMKTGMTFKQSDIDQLLTLKESTAKVQEMEFEKGIQRKTLELERLFHRRAALCRILYDG